VAVRLAVEPVVTALGLDLEDLDVQSSGRRRRVSVVVDRDGGVDLDGIAAASRAVS
jgi:ribosome maturation factor RimP